MFDILLIILRNKKYLVLAVLTTAIIATISYYLMIFNVYQYSLWVYADMNGIIFTIVTVVLGLIISILLGGHIALLVFRRDIIQARSVGNKMAGVGGALTGLIASGCPTCGAPLLALMGWPLGLFALPFYGLELKVLSVIFLLLAIFLISKNIRNNLTDQCSIKNQPTKQ
ncbi:MAG: hypothetical protein A3B89_01745 [Candidatus Buchananbacteria bacterium RIFCSPHIGHO2_02_FULL_40_13]|uniref:Uncharacterized protein n=1 Tax=Candidatus Buchananbacteria bacterium RIFCSPLOWO2_01_FULL_39_33 TaxID=1797543 RepID=A0A1G1YIU4_9BACT|nr:MAG: hypothetical protein A3B89_01745 [Candidatus Buchananbacteria bacterium RIFCSPHIGHO2_02_FULL_40_13]OGY52268.1 MAG: hypothetical protein A3A02_01700 [Candidatus Buchananbacteria bacterium RIFCSPLOWO2_01_FULL_39_33]